MSALPAPKSELRQIAEFFLGCIVVGLAIGTLAGLIMHAFGVLK